MQFLAIINFAAAIQGLFLAYLLVNKRSHLKEYRLLALLMLCMSLAILGPALGLSGYYRELPHLIRVSEPLALLLGPLLYFYISYLTRSRLPKGGGWHLLPFLAFALSLLPFYAQSGAAKIAEVERLLQARAPSLLPHTVRVLHGSAYIGASLVLVRRFQRVLEHNFSEVGHFNLAQAALLLRFYLFLAAVGYLLVLAALIWPINFVLLNNITSVAIGFIIYGLAYATWNRAALIPVAQLVPPAPLAAAVAEAPASPEKGRSTFNISGDALPLLADRLEKLLRQDQIFLQNDLSLQALSQYLDIPPYQASELISRQYQASFFDLINRCRVEEVKRRLEDQAYSHYSILGLALECGFNSKSSFNTAFKKFTGLTPSQYRKTDLPQLA